MKGYFLKFLLLSCSVSLTLFSFSCQSAAKKQSLSLLQTVELKSVSKSIISPDGSNVAYILTVPRKVYAKGDGKVYSELYVADLKGNSRQFITGKVKVSNIVWSTDSQSLYFLSKRGDDKFTSIYQISLNGGESTKIITHVSSISAFDINHDNSILTFLAKAATSSKAKKLKEKGFNALVYEESVKNSMAYHLKLTKSDAKAVKVKLSDHIFSLAYHPHNNNLLLRTAPSSRNDDDYTNSHYKI